MHDRAAVTDMGPQAILTDEDRKKFSTPEEYYNAKYPKRNVTFPRFELDMKDARKFIADPNKSYSKYNVDVRTILNSKSFMLPKIKVDYTRKQDLVQSVVNYLERITRYDFDRDGNVGVPSTLPDEHDAIALEGLKWIIDNIKYEHDVNNAWNLHHLRDVFQGRLASEEAMATFTKIIHEYWSFSYQTLKRENGDCEDGAILLYDVLRKSGIPAWKLRVNVGFVKGDEGNQGHAWLSYYVESQFWITKRDDKWVYLDWCYHPDKETNVKDRLGRGDDRSYDPIIDFSFNEDFTWSLGTMRFAPLFHTETCNIFHPDSQSKKPILFDWESKICTCGSYNQIVEN